MFARELTISGHPHVVTNADDERNIYLEGSMPLFQKQSQNLVKVAPAPTDFYKTELRGGKINAFENESYEFSIVINYLKPVLRTLRILGLLPVANSDRGYFVTIHWIVYSVLLLLFIMGYTAFIQLHKVEEAKAGEGRFEEAVIDYLFTVYLIPIVTNVIGLYEAKKQAEVLNQIISFEKIYNSTTKKKLDLFLANKPLLLSIALPIIGSGIMVVTHVTMSNFVVFKVIPYCYINVVTYMLGGAWYIYCNIIGKVATIIAEDFQQALKNIESSIKVADYRSMWMMLSRIIRNVGNSFGYALLFLCLYLFFVVTLTIYGLLSQIQSGMGTKDIGLTITASSAVMMLYFICDEAHYASACVRTNFQKKILLVELSWMDDDSQQEINMFLRATEMNPTDMCLCGFIDVNRNLFKSLLATMVTYLVVLLQFQISIPDDSLPDNNNTTTT
ncbi:gustatory and odorant receptor 24 isoform X2 [Cylas formicarius]|nr:gustatory and odorant receptor 24 isoform X2 [Cylas formicarius]